MRIFILLLLALAVAMLFTLFPEVARQPLRIEAFGWIFESRQGVFITVLIILLGIFWLVRRILTAILAGPGQLWRTLRMGGKKRREQRLREGIADMLDMQGDLGERTFKKARGIIPGWGINLLKTLITPAGTQPLPGSDDDPLRIALAARIATDPQASSKPDIPTRKLHLEAWVAVRPQSPLAISRLAELAEEERDWPLAVQLLEQAWKQGQRSAASIKPRLAHAYVELASEDTSETQAHLRKAQRLAPDSSEVILALGKAHIAENKPDTAKKLWLSHLGQHNDFTVAAALFELLKTDSLQAFRKLDKRNAASCQPAMRWLQARLARAAGLNGLATEIIDQLLESDATPEVLQSKAGWHEEDGEWALAAKYYQQLCDLKSDPDNTISPPET